MRRVRLIELLLMNSFLKWAGSKRRSLPTLIDMMPPAFDRYVEPFAGSACLFFAITPKKALLSDINAELVGSYLQLRDNVEAVISTVAKLPMGKTAFYSLRSVDPKSLAPVEQAARFIFLNRHCFNGLYRTNRSGFFNVPYGQRSGRVPPPDHLRECSRVLQSAKVSACTFDVTLDQVRPGDFVYLDPPYCIKARRVFNEYSNAAFDHDQLKILRQALVKMDKSGIPFLVSYGYSREALLLGKGFRQRHSFVARQIAGFAGSRRKSRELMFTNY
jgi:DNA adenine methylase